MESHLLKKVSKERVVCCVGSVEIRNRNIKKLILKGKLCVALVVLKYEIEGLKI